MRQHRQNSRLPQSDGDIEQKEPERILSEIGTHQSERAFIKHFDFWWRKKQALRKLREQQEYAANREQ